MCGIAGILDRWFRQEHRRAAQEILLDPKTLSRGYFRPETIRRLLTHHGSGRRDYSAWIWCLLVLELWCRQFIDQAHALDRTHPDPRLTHVAA